LNVKRLKLPKIASSGPDQSSGRLELDPVLGYPEAPISVVEYGAYGCSACRAWHEAEIIEQILQEFPSEVKFIYRDMPVILPAWSQEMSEVAQCALDQSNDAFWLMHDALYSQTIQGRTSQAEAIVMGASLGLDANTLQSCVAANTHYETVRYDMNRPEARGIRGTPTWFVNGQLIFNASPAVLRQTILDELAALD
jgi:protein-disulfide isomerase